MKYELQGSTQLFLIRGGLYTCEGLTDDKTVDDFWHYGIYWYAALKAKETPTPEPECRLVIRNYYDQDKYPYVFDTREQTWKQPYYHNNYKSKRRR